MYMWNTWGSYLMQILIQKISVQFCISTRLESDVDSAGPWTTLWIAEMWSLMCLFRISFLSFLCHFFYSFLLYAFLSNIFLLFLRTEVASPNLAVQGKGNIISMEEKLWAEDNLNEFLIYCVWRYLVCLYSWKFLLEKSLGRVQSP